MSFITNNTEFGIVSDSEIASIIANFSDDMIMDIVDKNSLEKFKPYQIYTGNLIFAMESDFKTNIESLPQFNSEILQRRNEIYTKILERLCSLHRLSLNINENTDLYSLTYFLYDFIISKFTINIVNFFTNYIIKEANTLYSYLELSDLKKNKDSTAIYSKKIFKGNSRLAVIYANIDSVLDNICVFDIELFDLILLSTRDVNIANFINNNVSEISSLFKTLFVPYIKDEKFRAVIITMIRLRLQQTQSNNNSEF